MKNKLPLIPVVVRLRPIRERTMEVDESGSYVRYSDYVELYQKLKFERLRLQRAGELVKELKKEMILIGTVTSACGKLPFYNADLIKSLQEEGAKEIRK